MKKQIHLNAFEMNCVGHISHGLWTHPENNRHRYTDLTYWTELAQLLEYGKFDAIFLADVVGVYDVYRGGSETAIREAVQIPVNDPFLLVPAMALVTKHLAFAVTASTTYEHPWGHARRMSTLDHLTNGRVAWNVVTSYLPSAARNYGLDQDDPPRRAVRDRRRVHGGLVQAVGGELGRRRRRARRRAARLHRAEPGPRDQPRRPVLHRARAHT